MGDGRDYGLRFTATDMVFFSVIIPTYNRASLLKRCLQSVVSCPFPDFEILVSDNASPDHTQEVLQSFNDPRLRFWRNETNLGAVKNQLKLLQEAQGEWIFFLTDDDFLMPGAIERLYAVLADHPEIGIVTSSVQNLDEQGSNAGVTQYQSGTHVYAPGLAALSALVLTAHLLSRVTIRRAWMNIDGFEKHMGSLYSQMFLVGAILKEHPGLYLDESLINHTVGNETFWEYHPDFMVGANIAMIGDLLPGAEWRTERRTLCDQIIAEVIVHHMPLTLSVSISNWITHQQHLWRVREVRHSKIYWLGLLKFVIKAALRRIRSKFVRQ